MRHEVVVNPLPAGPTSALSVARAKTFAPSRTAPDPRPRSGPIFGDASGHIYLAFTDTDVIDGRKPRSPTAHPTTNSRYRAADFASACRAASSGPRSPLSAARTSSLHERLAIQALATDPESDEVWVAIFDELVHIDRDGNRRAAYRTSTQEGTRIEPSALVIEHNRILIADDELGIFDFPLPERLLKPTSALTRTAILQQLWWLMAAVEKQQC